jgi:hypothetical protein
VFKEFPPSIGLPVLKAYESFNYAGVPKNSHLPLDFRC